MNDTELSIALAAARGLVNNYVSQNDQDRTKPLLLAILDYAPTTQGQWNISRKILECTNDSDKLRTLAERYQTGLLAPMISKCGQTPDTSDPPSRQESIEYEDTPNPLAVEGKVAMRQHNVEDLALRRDNYRSVISGIIDYTSVVKGLVEGKDNICDTQAAHILPFYLARRGEQSGLWALLEEFTGWALESELCGPNIDRLENVFTLTIQECSIIGGLRGWLEPVPGEENTYLTCAPRKQYAFHIGEIVRFSTSDPDLPLPNPKYIAIHAACAKVFHASGIEKYVCCMMDDWDESSVLPADGNSKLLSFAFGLKGIIVG